VDVGWDRAPFLELRCSAKLYRHRESPNREEPQAPFVGGAIVVGIFPTLCSFVPVLDCADRTGCHLLVSTFSPHNLVGGVPVQMVQGECQYECRRRILARHIKRGGTTVTSLPVTPLAYQRLNLTLYFVPLHTAHLSCPR
jgi:hypothetical protein